LDGTSPEKGILKDWPKTGLKKLWDCKLGLGYAPPVVAEGRLFHFDRFDDKARLTCRNAETGELVWKYEYDTEYVDQYGYDPGPRACPVVDKDVVYLHGVEGMLVAVAVETGKELWKVDTRKEYRFHQNFFGVGSVPIVHGELLIVAIGGSPKGERPFDLRQAKGNGTAIVAFEKKTGKEKYRLSDELASYSSPIVVRMHEKNLGLYFARGGLLGFDADTGNELFLYKWRAKILESVNAANPVVDGNRVFVSECYQRGSACVEISTDFKVKEVWTDQDKESDEKALLAHWCTPIRDGQFLYGSSGRHTPEGELRCVDMKTGKVLWSEPQRRRSTVTKIDGHGLCLLEDGTLCLFQLNSEKYIQVAIWKEVEDLEYPCWAPPVISRGLLYLRGEGKLACYELVPAR
jgi:outer membrane protein assembly factor BamB